MRDTIVLDTASANSSMHVTKPESQLALDVRKMLGDKLLGGIILGGVEDHDGVVTVTLKALRSSDVKSFEDRLRAAAISYQMKTEPN